MGKKRSSFHILNPWTVCLAVFLIFLIVSLAPADSYMRKSINALFGQSSPTRMNLVTGNQIFNPDEVFWDMVSDFLQKIRPESVEFFLSVIRLLIEGLKNPFVLLTVCRQLEDRLQDATQAIDQVSTLISQTKSPLKKWTLNQLLTKLQYEREFLQFLHNRFCKGYNGDNPPYQPFPPISFPSQRVTEWLERILEPVQDNQYRLPPLPLPFTPLMEPAKKPITDRDIYRYPWSDFVEGPDGIYRRVPTEEPGIPWNIFIVTTLIFAAATTPCAIVALPAAIATTAAEIPAGLSMAEAIVLAADAATAEVMTTVGASSSAFLLYIQENTEGPFVTLADIKKGEDAVKKYPSLLDKYEEEARNKCDGMTERFREYPGISYRGKDPQRPTTDDLRNYCSTHNGELPESFTIGDMNQQGDVDPRLTNNNPDLHLLVPGTSEDGEFIPADVEYTFLEVLATEGLTDKDVHAFKDGFFGPYMLVDFSVLNSGEEKVHFSITVGFAGLLKYCKTLIIEGNYHPQEHTTSDITVREGRGNIPTLNVKLPPKTGKSCATGQGSGQCKDDCDAQHICDKGSCTCELKKNPEKEPAGKTP